MEQDPEELRVAELTGLVLDGVPAPGATCSCGATATSACQWSGPCRTVESWPAAPGRVFRVPADLVASAAAGGGPAVLELERDPG